MRRQDSNLQPSGHEPDEITISLLRNLSTGCPVFVFDEGRVTLWLICTLVEGPSRPSKERAT